MIPVSMWEGGMMRRSGNLATFIAIVVLTVFIIVFIAQLVPVPIVFVALSVRGVHVRIVRKLPVFLTPPLALQSIPARCLSPGKCGG